MRELKEETGLEAARYVLTDWRKQNQYEIFHRWRGRYAPGVTHNTEHVFSPARAAAASRSCWNRASTCGYEWLPWRESRGEGIFVDQRGCHQGIAAAH